jgi:hypothetical protein
MEQKIIALIKTVPKEALPGILTAVVRCCLSTKVFKDKKLSDIVASIEAAHKGQ